MPIEGSVAVVTGSARGVGRAIAEALVAAGARVELADAAPEFLSGRFLDPRRDLSDYIAEEERIVREDLYTLRIRGR